MVPSVILALDVEDKNKARAILQATGDKLEWVKIGLQTYLRDGPDFVREVADSGKRVFLDLKLYDIPNTMAKALESLADLPIGMLTLHASAGPEALTRCSEFADKLMPDTLLLAVTVLTSMDQEILSSIGVIHRLKSKSTALLPSHPMQASAVLSALLSSCPGSAPCCPTRSSSLPLDPPIRLGFRRPKKIMTPGGSTTSRSRLLGHRKTYSFSPKPSRCVG